ncbi:hypothetical protein EOD41_12730 [Mucilaginibacter limnophilus]|uniref:Uncharacterized protein n=1 Tax=Mucilaginibacter limnophilus TaxID=1932778 RepID=A0A3S2Y040_9SPHI|nr:hypothetical protein [Mucilaginibacter limnophilus]RVU00342.1 hypothetical protein EOD41_12730 [Mucilaginibacter limnophilus]
MGYEEGVYWKFDELVKNLIILSSTAERQKELMGHGCVADEMAEDFHSYFTLSKQEYLDAGLINQQQFDRLNELDQLLDNYSGDQNPDFWDDQQLSSNEDWKVLRKIARDILELLGKSDLEISYERKEEYVQNEQVKRLITQYTKFLLVKKK